MNILEFTKLFPDKQNCKDHWTKNKEKRKRTSIAINNIKRALLGTFHIKGK